MKFFENSTDSHRELDEILNYNAYIRNKWVAEKASEVPSGSRLLDVGAGECVYRDLFNHCEYKTQDFVCIPVLKKGCNKRDRSNFED